MFGFSEKAREDKAKKAIDVFTRARVILQRVSVKVQNSMLFKREALSFEQVEDELKIFVGMSRALIDTNESLHLMHKDLGEIVLQIPENDAPLKIEFKERDILDKQKSIY